MHSRTRQLRDLMEQHELQPGDVARLAGVKPPTAYGWLTSSSPYVIPQHRLDLLALRLERARQANPSVPALEARA